MITTINGLLVFLIALIPGVPGERAYSTIVGLDWREDQLRRVIRIVLFSISGLILYVLIAQWWGWWMPQYLIPQTYTTVGEDVIFKSAVTYLGHGFCAFLVGAGSAWGRYLTAAHLGQTVYPTAWHDLIRNYTEDHWIVVTLENGKSFAGILETADASVPHSERDILLKEPALYDEEKKDYIALAYQHLFLPSALIDSVAVLYSEDIDAENRITEVNRGLFGPQIHE